MTPLSEQLSTLSAQAKKAEDALTEARDKNQAALQAHRAALKGSASTAEAVAQQRVAATETATATWWDETRSTLQERFAGLRASADEHRNEHDLKRALRRADAAEADADDAVALAVYILVQAEWAVVDAAIARGEADLLGEQDQ